MKLKARPQSFCGAGGVAFEPEPVLQPVAIALWVMSLRR